jgi:hypothetical protein
MMNENPITKRTQPPLFSLRGHVRRRHEPNHRRSLVFQSEGNYETNPTIPLFSAAAGMGQGITLIAINPDSGIIEPAFNPIEVPGNDQRQTHRGRNARLQRGEDS